MAVADREAFSEMSAKTVHMPADKKGPEAEEKTDWRGIIVASVLSFFCGTQITMYYSTLWPFLLQLDPHTPETFFGFINAAHSLAQAITAVLFGYLVNRLEKNRSIMIVGFTMMTIGNSLYLLCSTQLTSARWLIFFSRVFVGIGSGVYTVFRNYIVQVSTFNDRSRAISTGLAAFALGISAGHAVQAVFSSLGYPGMVVIGSLNLSRYTAPAFAGLFFNLFSILVTVFVFREACVPESSSENRANAKGTLPPYDKLAVAICIFTQFVYMVMVTNGETVHPPYMMTMFNWTKKEAQFYGAIRLAASGFIALAIYCVDIAFNLWNRLNQRIGAITGTLCVFVFHLLTFSWWFLPGELKYQDDYIVVNGTQLPNPEPTGCRKSFEWCKDVTPVNVWLFNILYPILCGAGIAFINANMNTVYSKVIGPRKQGTLMGLLVCVGCLAKTIGPLALSSTFRFFGPRPVWVSVMLFSGGCALLWTVFYNRLKPLNIATSN